ncbi:glycosyltransferase family 2 protein [Alkalicoccus daliensis]|uniref:Glycosyltransferase involved in cell wall bisynthesis n=1 Tax=Alkalicoccus daliensis TaxID=745820 RepID=A0A1G9ZM26_9BACI|nr:glycosyltransferase family A protein [Alkalicoccus daliensis]SDN22187.1 Glycosyltransferase involved in cell wall bisynthesis [Alkalicoccus daliensis]
MVKISIILPITSKEGGIVNCLRSILNQSFQEFELILINTGASKKIIKEAHEFKKKDNRIKFLNETISDIPSAKNAGIVHAQGDYIGFIDIHDMMHSNMLEILYSEMLLNKADISICDFKPIEEGVYLSHESEVLKNKVAIHEAKILNNQEALRYLYSTDRTFTMNWNKLYKKELIAQYPFPKDTLDEEEFTAHQLLFQSTTVVYIKADLYFYVIVPGRKGSITPITMTKQMFKKMKALYERVNLFHSNNLPELEKLALRHFSEHFFWYYIESQKALPDASRERKEIFKLFKKLYPKIIMNKSENIKKKIVYSVFIVSPNLYNQLTVNLERRKEGA